MIFCDAGCSGVWEPRNGRVSSSLLRLTEEPASEGIMVGRGAWGLGTGAGGIATLASPARAGVTGGDLLGIRRVIVRWLGCCAQSDHSGGDVMVTAVLWLAADGYWRERCVRHVPDSVRAFLTALELPGFVEVREVDERRFTCPACWAERMTGR